MSKYQVDLTNCDKEPIHIPGKIQAHGFLVAINSSSNLISYISENIKDYITQDAAFFLDQPFSQLEEYLNLAGDKNQLSSLINLVKNNKNFDLINPYQAVIRDHPYNVILTSSNNELILEFEHGTSDVNFDIQKTIGRSVSEILSGKNLNTLLTNAAFEIKKIIQYDRVMIYKFHMDGHGEVIAEVKNDDLEPFLGLHYPASDIPKQARELYKTNLTRIIADVNSTSSSIITFQDENAPLNLSNSALRAVSPIHIQYLKKMGVQSSISISLLAHDELWGLVACHNYSPRFINYKARDASKLIGQILSSALQYRQEEEYTEKLRALDKNANELSKHIKFDSEIADALTTHSISLKDITNAAGVALIFNNTVTQIGITPNEEQLKELIIWLTSHMQNNIYYTNCLPEQFLPAKNYSNVASGILACMLSKELNELIIWFKPEQIEAITWAGNPDKPVEQAEDGSTQLRPGKSFEAWTELVKNTSDRWSNKEVSTVAKIREEILDAVNRKANETRLLNEKLQSAYNELDIFSYTISHDLRTPLSSIKSYSEFLLLKNKSLDDSAKKMLSRIVSGTDKMNFLIKEILHYAQVGKADIELVKIDMQTLLKEIKDEVISGQQFENVEFTIGETPALLGDKTMISQVFTNLLNNAVKYSSRSNPPKVKVEGAANHDETIYTVTDNGLGIDVTYYSRVFELFKRMDNVRDYEGTGVGLAIVKRIVEKHKARIWFESELGMGTTFYIAFKN